MHLKDLNGKRVIILGFGREGRAMLDVLAKVNADVTIGDQSEKLIVNSEKLKVNTQVGSKYLQNLDKF